MQIGVHVSIAGGVDQAPLNAKTERVECFQLFTRSPRGGKAPVLTPELVDSFKKNCAAHGYTNYYVHAPYYINFASANGKIRNGSASIIREELERSSKLGVRCLMTHLGSSKDVGVDRADSMVVAGLQKALKGYTGSTQFLIENAAGAGHVIGATFEGIQQLLEALEGFSVGACFDTCHAFASGYDLRTPEAVNKTLKHFDRTIGLKLIKVIHANDSKGEFNSRLDRHAHIGEGAIGKKGFQALLHHPALRDVDFILETPDDGRGHDLDVLKKLRQ